MNHNTNEFKRRIWRADNHSAANHSAETTPAMAALSVVALLREDAREVPIPLMWLIVAQPLRHRGQILPVRHGAVIGRRGDLRWADPRMSRQHARFSLDVDDDQGLRFSICPASDHNETLVNGTPIHAMILLHENDQIQMGDTLFIVKTLE